MDACGVTNAALVYCFGNKDNIIVEVTARCMARAEDDFSNTMISHGIGKWSCLQEGSRQLHFQRDNPEESFNTAKYYHNLSTAVRGSFFAVFVFFFNYDIAS